jgi:hypothetical protein
MPTCTFLNSLDCIFLLHQYSDGGIKKEKKKKGKEMDKKNKNVLPTKLVNLKVMIDFFALAQSLLLCGCVCVNSRELFVCKSRWGKRLCIHVFHQR